MRCSSFSSSGLTLAGMISRKNQHVAQLKRWFRNMLQAAIFNPAFQTLCWPRRFLSLLSCLGFSTLRQSVSTLSSWMWTRQGLMTLSRIAAGVAGTLHIA